MAVGAASTPRFPPKVHSMGFARSCHSRSISLLALTLLGGGCVAAGPDAKQEAVPAGANAQAFTTLDPNLQASNIDSYAQTSPVTNAGIFAPKAANVDVVFDLDLPSSMFFQPGGTLAQRGASGFHLAGIAFDSAPNSTAL